MLPERLADLADKYVSLLLYVFVVFRVLNHRAVHILGQT